MVTADGRCRELICHEEVPLGLIEFELQVGHDYLTPGELLALYSGGTVAAVDVQHHVYGHNTGRAVLG